MNSTNETLQEMISVLMLSYNHEAFIKQALESILAQEYVAEFEIIVADDGSTDKTEDEVNRIINSHPKGKCIRFFKHEKNKGLMANFVWSLKQARGNYVALCEGDDFWIDPKKLKNQQAFMQMNPGYSFFCNNIVHVNEDGSERSDRWPGFTHSFKISYRLIGEEYPVATNTLFIRKMSLDKVINAMEFMIKPSTLGDYSLISLLLSQGPGYYSPKVVAAYRHHNAANFSTNSIQEKVKRGLVTRDLLIAYWIKHFNWLFALIALKNRRKFKNRYLL
ncbi:MAG: glycosyltransferase family 2 protein [Crocinitomicaceae bacterium]